MTRTFDVTITGKFKYFFDEDSFEEVRESLVSKIWDAIEEYCDVTDMNVDVKHAQ